MSALAYRNIVDYAVSMLFREEFLRTLKMVPPISLRVPSINEVMMVDRRIRQDVLSLVTKDGGTLADGLK
eukprot:13929661-Heterocapsa_arctica.AAC.1